MSRSLTGSVWLVDAELGQPLTSAPHRQGGVQLVFGTNGRSLGVAYTDDAGQWTYQGPAPQWAVVFAEVPNPEQPPVLPGSPGYDPHGPGWLRYAGGRDAIFPPGVTHLTRDVTAWRYQDFPPRAVSFGCTPDHLEFGGGLLALSFALGEVMGQPLECEHVALNGDVLQATSTGLAYQVARSDQYVFTDGSQQWTLGRDGEVEAVSD